MRQPFRRTGCSQAASDLLWRPSSFEAVHDVDRKRRFAGEFAQTLTPGAGLHVGGHMEIAPVQRLLIVNPVPFDLAVDGRTMPLQAFSHHTDRDLGRVHAGDRAVQPGSGGCRAGSFSLRVQTLCL
jgi:hypothetical protein